MRFREAGASDVGTLASLFEGNNALPLEPRVREALPFLLARAVSSPACTLTLFEEDGRTGPRALALAGGMFLREPVVERYLAAPFPGLLSSVLAEMLDGAQPLLTLDEIRRANATGGLTVAVFPIPYGKAGWGDPQLAELRKLAPQAFMRYFGGYRPVSYTHLTLPTTPYV
jgi:hypothetical protein